MTIEGDRAGEIADAGTPAPSQSVERERANLIRAITHNHVDKADWKAYDAALIEAVRVEQAALLGIQNRYPLWDVLRILADHATHSLGAHSCDHAGYENVMATVEWAHTYARIAQYEPGERRVVADAAEGGESPLA